MTTKVQITDSRLDFQRIIADLLAGKRDRASMRAAGERLDRAREEIRRRLGTVDFAVGAIREMRDE